MLIGGIILGLAALLGAIGGAIFQDGYDAYSGASETTKRKFDSATERKFLGLLKERFPEPGGIEIKFVDVSLIPFAKRLEQLFNSAGWNTNLNQNPIPPNAVKQWDGFKVIGVNEHFVDEVITVFRDVGVTDIIREIRENQIPKTNPKWPMTQKDADIEIGYAADQN